MFRLLPKVFTSSASSLLSFSSLPLSSSSFPPLSSASAFGFRFFAAAPRKPHCNVGTIGHVDHGKTTLTAAITKHLAKKGLAKFLAYDQIDKTEEERQRGITISASHVEYETDKRHYSHIDCPGHQNYIKNMIVGAAQMDGAVLVVAGTEGPQEQTREHMLLARETGIQQIVVFLNKVDSLQNEPDLIDMAEEEVRALLAFYGFDSQAPVIRGSARLALEEATPSEMGTGAVQKLVDAIDNYIKQPERNTTAPFLMNIEDVFSIQGRGTVVTGKIDQGTIKVGDEVEAVGILPTQKTVCIGVEQFNKPLDMAIAGENIGALLRGVSNEQVTRGMVLSKPGTVKASKSFIGKTYLLKEDEGGRKHPILSGFQPQFFIRSANVTGTITFRAEGDKNLIMPGDTGEFEVQLLAPLALAEGQRFTVREGKLTVGAGVIVKVLDAPTAGAAAGAAGSKTAAGAKPAEKGAAGAAGAGAAKPAAAGGAKPAAAGGAAKPAGGAPAGKPAAAGGSKPAPKK